MDLLYPMHITCAWDFFMKARLLIHYRDGKTFKGDWDTFHPFKDLNTKPISSLQIQSLDNLYTLSSNKKNSEFFSRYYEDRLSIMRHVSKNIWIELSINRFTEEQKINIIEEYIENA
jgi:hypothetical protein